MTDYRQADIDEARKTVSGLTSKEYERIARALARRERLGAEKLQRGPVVPLLRVVIVDSEVPHG